MIWELKGSGVFIVRSYYEVLHGASVNSFPWCVKAPRGSLFSFGLQWQKILTYDNLIKQGFTLVGWCRMCWCSGEILDHLLIHSGDLWSQIFTSWGFNGSDQGEWLIFCLDGGIGLGILFANMEHCTIMFDVVIVEGEK